MYRKLLVPLDGSATMLPSAAALAGYLNQSEPLDEIFMMLFSHGVDSIGLASIQKWQELLSRATKEGRLVGVDDARQECAGPECVSARLCGFVRYYYDLLNKIKARYPIPPPLMLNQLDDFLGRTQAAIRSSGREFRLLRRRR